MKAISKVVCDWLTRCGPKMGQIGPKWDKAGTFSDQISVHFEASARISDLDTKWVRLAPNGTNLGLFQIKMY